MMGLVAMVTSTLPSTSSERNTVIHHVSNNIGKTQLHYVLVAMVTSTLPSTSSERNTVIHHVRTSIHGTMMAGHHFTLLVYITTPTLYNICCQLDESIHWLRTRMTTLHCTMLVATMTSSNYFNHSKSAGQPSQCTRSLN